jgi:hypothetical protein
MSNFGEVIVKQKEEKSSDQLTLFPF